MAMTGSAIPPHAGRLARRTLLRTAIVSTALVSAIGLADPAEDVIRCKFHDVREACIVEAGRWEP